MNSSSPRVFRVVFSIGRKTKSVLYWSKICVGGSGALGGNPQGGKLSKVVTDQGGKRQGGENPLVHPSRGGHKSNHDLI